MLWEQDRFTNYSQFSMLKPDDKYDTSHQPFHFKPQPAHLVKIEWQCGLNETCQTFTVDYPVFVQRKWFPYYFYGLFIPQLSLSLLQLSAFFIPYDNSDRIMYSVTLFVAYAISGSEVGRLVPETAENIPIVMAINLAIVNSMLATIYFSIMFKVCSMTSEPNLKYQKIDLSIFIIFILAYIILYIMVFAQIY